MPDEKPYNITHLDTKEKKQIQELVKSLASEERIGIDEHVYKDNRISDRWGINPFQLFDLIKQILSNPEIIRKELHSTEYFPTRYLCESELNEDIYPCVIRGENMKKNEEYEDVYEDVVIENYGIPVVITDVLVRKHKSTGRKMYINHPDSINKIEKGLKSALGVVPRGQTSYKRKLSESGKILLLRLPKELRESYHIEKGTKALITPIGANKAILEFE